MKAIFLDINGVLDDYNKNEVVIKGCEIQKDKMERLKYIVETTNAVLVLSSSLHTGLSDDLKPLTKNMERILKCLELYGLKLYGKTPVQKEESHRRVDIEIKMYLDEHPEITTWIVLNDDPYEMKWEEYNEHLVKTSKVPFGQYVCGYLWEDVGLKDEHVQEAIEKLNTL